MLSTGWGASPEIPGGDPMLSTGPGASPEIPGGNPMLSTGWGASPEIPVPGPHPGHASSRSRALQRRVFFPLLSPSYLVPSPSYPPSSK